MPVALEMWFDLRVPKWTGNKTGDIYRTAVDMCSWADEMGFQAVTVGEHHTTDDQYNTSPVMVASAIGARTKALQLRMIILCPFYNTLRLAEDLAVLNLLTDNRAVPVISAGYRAAEFDMFGVRRDDRANIVEETIETIRAAWSGQPFTYRGRPIEICSPVPDLPPRLLMGASFPKMIRKAAAIADGLSPAEARLYDMFRQERVKLGKSDPGDFPTQGTDFMFITEEPEKAWDMLVPYWTHSAKIYNQWASEIGKPVNDKFPLATNAEELKSIPTYKVMTPEECVEYASSLGENGELRFQPMPGGLDPEIAWSSLKLFEKKVLPHLDVKFTSNILY